MFTAFVVKRAGVKIRADSDEVRDVSEPQQRSYLQQRQNARLVLSVFTMTLVAVGLLLWRT